MDLVLDLVAVPQRRLRRHAVGLEPPGDVWLERQPRDCRQQVGDGWRLHRAQPLSLACLERRERLTARAAGERLRPRTGAGGEGIPSALVCSCSHVTRVEPSVAIFAGLRPRGLLAGVGRPRAQRGPCARALRLARRAYDRLVLHYVNQVALEEGLAAHHGRSNSSVVRVGFTQSWRCVQRLRNPRERRARRRASGESVGPSAHAHRYHGQER